MLIITVQHKRCDLDIPPNSHDYTTKNFMGTSWENERFHRGNEKVKLERPAL